MKTVTIYTDGACSGNPGPGGWGAVLRYGAHERELSGGEAQTTNNRMELTAVIEALRLLKEPCEVELYSDSKYVIDALWTFGSGCCRSSRRTTSATTGSRGTRRTNTTTAATSSPWPRAGNTNKAARQKGGILYGREYPLWLCAPQSAAG